MTPPEMPNIDHLVLPPPIIAAPLPPVKLKKVLTNEAQRNGLIKLLSDTFKSGKVTFALGAPQGGKATYEILLDGKSVGSFTPLGEDFDNLVSVTLNKKDYDLKKDGTVTAAKTVEGIIIDDE